jgi:predicted transcriptional regulator
MSTTQGIKLEKEISQRLKQLGQIRDRSPHWLMRTAIEEYLEREEKYEREKREDMERWERCQIPGYAISNEIALQWLDALADGKDVPCPE